LANNDGSQQLIW